MKKQILVGIVLGSVLTMGNAMSALADPSCTKLLETTCTSCHSKAKFCANLGQNKEFWTKTLKQMVEYGATVSAAEQTTLADCLSKSSDEAKGICKK